VEQIYFDATVDCGMHGTGKELTMQCIVCRSVCCSGWRGDGRQKIKSAAVVWVESEISAARERGANQSQ